MAYKSKYKGFEVDDALSKALTAASKNDLAAK
jgi:hypothetical protein